MVSRDAAGAQNGRRAGHDESGTRFALSLGGGGGAGRAPAAKARQEPASPARVPRPRRDATPRAR